MKLKNTDKEKIILLLKEKIPLQLLILFGSFAEGHATLRSDIDLAFISADKIDEVARWEIAQELAIIMRRDVDLVNMETASDVFKFEIVTKGEILFQEGNFDAYLDRAYTMYMQLNDDRKEILEFYGR
jgi:predicted nucleotidyltransferase